MNNVNYFEQINGEFKMLNELYEYIVQKAQINNKVIKVFGIRGEVVDSPVLNYNFEFFVGLLMLLYQETSHNPFVKFTLNMGRPKEEDWDFYLTYKDYISGKIRSGINYYQVKSGNNYTFKECTVFKNTKVQYLVLKNNNLDNKDIINISDIFNSIKINLTNKFIFNRISITYYNLMFNLLKEAIEANALCPLLSKK